jgi:hypothetical protein
MKSVRLFVLLAVIVASSLITTIDTQRVEASDVELTNALGLSDPIVGTDIGGLGGQYRNNNQRNFWWNAHRQRWDAILPTG